MLTERQASRDESSCVFPGDKGYFASSEAIISSVHQETTGFGEVKWIAMGTVTGGKESLANCYR